MSKYEVRINGEVIVAAVGNNNVVTVVVGDGARIIQHNQPRPYSEAKLRMWDALMKGEARYRKMPLVSIQDLLDLRDALDRLWEQYYEME